MPALHSAAARSQPSPAASAAQDADTSPTSLAPAPQEGLHAASWLPTPAVAPAVAPAAADDPVSAGIGGPLSGGMVSHASYGEQREGAFTAPPGSDQQAAPAANAARAALQGAGHSGRLDAPAAEAGSGAAEGTPAATAVRSLPQPLWAQPAAVAQAPVGDSRLSVPVAGSGSSASHGTPVAQEQHVPGAEPGMQHRSLLPDAGVAVRAGDVQTGGSVMSVTEATGEAVIPHPGVRVEPEQLLHATAQTCLVQELGGRGAGLSSGDHAQAAFAPHLAGQSKLGAAVAAQAVERGMSVLALEDSAQPVQAGMLQPSHSVQRDQADLLRAPARTPPDTPVQAADLQERAAEAMASHGSGTQQRLTPAGEKRQVAPTLPRQAAVAAGGVSVREKAAEADSPSTNAALASGQHTVLSSKEPAVEAAAVSHDGDLQKEQPNPTLLRPRAGPPQEVGGPAEQQPQAPPARPAAFRRALAALQRPSRLGRMHVEPPPAAELEGAGALLSEEAEAGSPQGSMPASPVLGRPAGPNPSIYRAAREPSRVDAEEPLPPGPSTPAFLRAMRALAQAQPAQPVQQVQQPGGAAPEHGEEPGAFGSPIFGAVPALKQAAGGPGAGEPQRGQSKTPQGAACLHMQRSRWFTCA